MLDGNSYLTAIYIYVGAALFALIYLAWWLSRHWRPSWVALVVLLLAALLLTPAYPRAGVTTMAPALIVAVFQVATENVEAANHAIRPLIFMSGMAVVITLLLNMTVFRWLRARKKPPQKTTAKA